MTIPLVIHGLARSQPYEFIVRLVDGTCVAVKVYSTSYEDAEWEASFEASRLLGQDVAHLVDEIEGV